MSLEACPRFGSAACLTILKNSKGVDGRLYSQQEIVEFHCDKNIQSLFSQAHAYENFI
jgi:hypothetical protein